METRYATYSLMYARDVSGLCVSLSEYVCLRQRGKTVKMPYESPILFVRNPNGIVRLLSEPHTETQTPASVCSEIYIRTEIFAHPYVREISVKSHVRHLPNLILRDAKLPGLVKQKNGLFWGGYVFRDKGICFSVREIENNHVHLPDKRNEKK